MTPPVVFRGATLLPGGSWAPLRGMDVSVRDGRITAIGPCLPPCPSAETVPAGDLLLMPAFDNAHTHSPEMLARGRAPMARQAEWLATAYAGGIDALDEAQLQGAVRSAAQDIVRGGATGVTDHFRQIPPRLDAMRAATAAWARTGLQVRLAVMLRDRGMPPGLAPMPLASLLSLAAACLAEAPQGVRIGLGPSAPQRCSDPLLDALARLAKSAGTFLHMHVCETAEDAAACQALYGETAVSHLDRLGVLGPTTELAHCVHVNDDDLRRLAATGTVMVHNPVANLRLGSGVAPVARALALGVRVRLGTDGAGSNDAQSMLEATKMACLLPRACGPQTAWLSPEAALDLATGGRRLQPGETANLLAFDLRASAFAGGGPELAARVVLAARETDIVHVVSRGRFLLRNGHLVTGDAS